jgi:hypothetical protein
MIISQAKLPLTSCYKSEHTKYTIPYCFATTGKIVCMLVMNEMDNHMEG